MDRNEELLVNKYNPKRYSIHSYRSDITSNGDSILDVSFLDNKTGHISIEEFNTDDEPDIYNFILKYYEFI